MSVYLPPFFAGVVAKLASLRGLDEAVLGVLGLLLLLLLLFFGSLLGVVETVFVRTADAVESDGVLVPTESR